MLRSDWMQDKTSLQRTCCGHFLSCALALLLRVKALLQNLQKCLRSFKCTAFRCSLLDRWLPRMAQQRRHIHLPPSIIMKLFSTVGVSVTICKTWKRLRYSNSVITTADKCSTVTMTHARCDLETINDCRMLLWKCHTTRCSYDRLNKLQCSLHLVQASIQTLLKEEVT